MVTIGFDARSLQIQLSGGWALPDARAAPDHEVDKIALGEESNDRKKG